MSIYSLGTARTVQQLLEARRYYPTESVCLSPFCIEPITYPTHHAGRRQLFCSPRCRMKYRDYRDHLTAERSHLIDQINTCGLPRLTKIALEQQLSLLDWTLVHFPPTNWVKQSD